MRSVICALGALSLGVGACDGRGGGDAQQPTGQGETVFTTGEDPENPFFKAIGTNQRTCATCHDPDAGWSITPSMLQARFDATEGMDPVFRPNDGSRAPGADVSAIAARRTAYDLLLERGVIRVGIAIPEGAEFTLAAVSDPGGFASATELSLFRRPLPAANLRFLSQIMWDSREPSLDQQAADATLGHAQAMAVDGEAMDAIVAFESSLYTAQRIDDVAGDLTTDGARGGAATLVTQTYTAGINDSAGATFTRDVFTLFSAWSGADRSTDRGQRRAAIARGERLFNTKTFRIRGVAGLPNQQGTCSTCHDTPNVGSRSTGDPLDIGVSDEDQRPDGAPLYTLRNTATGATVKTTDPGLALITGRWGDIGKFKVPVLRGLAQRPPYFHNGRADNLDDVLDFYRRKLDIDFDGGERSDLVAFLSAL